MAYVNINAQEARRFCEALFQSYGFSAQESETITDVLLLADLYGIESHGVQRLIRYAKAIQEGSIKTDATIRTVYETPCSAVWDAPCTMGQIAAKKGMETAIAKAKSCGFGTVAVRGSNHLGIAGYYTKMAAEQDMLGICMTNTEAIAIPTGGRKAMLGTSPIAVCMPADPVPFWYDAATTVITRGKLEVYQKAGKPLPSGWTADEKGLDCTDAGHIIENICNKAGGGIFPLGGPCELTGSHKGYGLGIVVELFTSIFSGGTTSPHIQHSGNADTSFSFFALDYGMFGDKAQMKARMSTLLQELRDSPKAENCTRIYTHGEKELENQQYFLKHGIPVNQKTLQEMREIGRSLGLNLDEYIKEIRL